MNHPKMHALRTEAGNALVLIETGAVEGITRAVQAATAPTEAQRVLQNGYRGAIANGESREQVSATICADGLLTHQRLVERSAVLPDGGGVNVQQVQQAVVAPGDSVKDDVSRLMMTAIIGTNSIMSTLINTVQIKISALDSKDDALDAKNAELETKTNMLLTKNAELEARSVGFEARLSAIEGKRRRVGAAPGLSKNSHLLRAEHPELPKNIQGRNGQFGWKRCVNGKSTTKQGFSSIALAQTDMHEFYGGTDAADGAVGSQSTIGQ